MAETTAQRSRGQARQLQMPIGVRRQPPKLLHGLGCENAQGCELKLRGAGMSYAKTWLDQNRLREIPIIDR